MGGGHPQCARSLALRVAVLHAGRSPLAPAPAAAALQAAPA